MGLERKPTILHVVPSFGFGGMERVMCSVIEALQDAWTHRVLSLDGCLDATAWLHGGAVSVVPFTRPGGRFRYFNALGRVLSRERPALLMTYNWGATDAIWLGRMAGLTSIVHSEHGLNADESAATYRRRDAVRWLVYRLAAKVIVVSSSYEATMQHRYRLGSERVLCIPNGIDPAHYGPDPKGRVHVRHELGFHDRDVVVGFCGRLDPVKDVGFLIASFAEARLYNPDLKLLIVGDGPERDRLTRLCAEKGVSAHVRFVGVQPDVRPYLAAMDLLAITSLREQMPRTVLEAMASEVPVVAKPVGDLPGMIEHGRDGLLVSSEGPGAFAEALGAMEDPCKRQAMGRAARAKILSAFDERIMVHRYQRLLEQVVNPSDQKQKLAV